MKISGGKASVLTPPQLLLDVSDYWNKNNQVYIGAEYSYWSNKSGINGMIERAPQVMILIPF
ncbi:hypothetical protein [Methylophaga sp.]|uniref:hypothetical protein n=1 Tax=Methylophaga sp. TaxID=2024840 RepID=UPI003F694E70